MNPVRIIDLEPLRPVLSRWLWAVMVMAFLVAGSLHYLDKRSAARGGAEERLAIERQRFLAREQAQTLRKEYLGRYQELKRRGVVDSDMRLGWIETVRRVAAELGIPRVRVELLPAAPLEHPGLPGTVSATPMPLELGLLHELDLLRLLKRLAQEAPGLFWVESCRLTRDAAPSHFRPDRINLRGDCRLLWLTVRSVSGERS